MTIEVRSVSTKKIYLQRKTIGTRRTKTLTAGDYEWRIYDNKQIMDTSWHKFSVVRPIGNKKLESQKVNKVTTPAEKKIPLKVETRQELVDNEKYYEIVKKYLKQTTKRPETLEYLEWYAPRLNEEENVYLVRVRFRALNSFKELKESEMLFYILNTKVIGVENLAH